MILAICIQDASMHTYAQNYLPLLRTYQDELLQRLELLVNIDSGTGQREGIDDIITHLQQWLSDIDFTVSLHDSGQYGRNLVATHRGKGHARLLVVGHIDTVYKPGAASVQPFYVQDGLAYGPGVIDMKSGVLMGIYAVRALIESGFEQYGELTLFFNNDEEIGSLGSAPLLRHIARQIDAALVLEPSRSAEIITNARKGADRYILEVQGVPAHSGAEPHRGRSAVIELAHKMIAIHTLNTMFRGVTFNVTRISSSEQLNVVPDVAHCHISVRAFDEDGLDQAAAALEAIRTGCSIPGTRTTLARTRGRSPYKATTGIARLVEMAQAEGKALGLHLMAESKGGVSDANLLAESGIPALDSLGPVGGGMHDLHREYLRVESLPLRGALLAGLIQRLCLSESTGA
jgi:glutamate carboxypeptidase